MLDDLVSWCIPAKVRSWTPDEDAPVSRLTITLDDQMHRALKETAARQGRTITSIIEESLRLRGIRDQASARALVAQARERARLAPGKALELAVEETRATREG